MAIKIHHGPPGSYKTSGAIMDDLPKVVKEGRTLVTNVRGLTSRERILEVIDGDPRFDVIHIDTSQREGLERLRRWFHWVPKGAFLIIDEAQRVWPPRWTDRQLSALSIEGGEDAAAEMGRPEDHWTAFDMHRHFNWDLVLTTTNIRKIHSTIRESSEGAYKHRNMALIGVGGFYNEAFHAAGDSGSSTSQFLSIRKRRIRSWVWNLYESTDTGDVRDTHAGTPLWKNPRVAFLGAIVLAGFGYGFRNGIPDPFTPPDAGQAVAERQAPGPSPAEPGSTPAAPAAAPRGDGAAPVQTRGQARRPARPATGHLGDRAARHQRRHGPLSGWDMTVVGEFRSVWIEVERGDARMTLRGDELGRLGYSYRRLSDCIYRITHIDTGVEQLATCRKRGEPVAPELLPGANLVHSQSGPILPGGNDS
ncbi:zonular occludens toxin family protein [Arhodomonas sp. AD133]|uniref:zonular occludens toxin family protein n=1 Tax=Arhodomonas sp. AD133 TaxID=3415009 RepID=UPI003EBDA685